MAKAIQVPFSLQNRNKKRRPSQAMQYERPRPFMRETKVLFFHPIGPAFTVSLYRVVPGFLPIEPKVRRKQGPSFEAVLYRKLDDDDDRRKEKAEKRTRVLPKTNS